MKLTSITPSRIQQAYTHTGLTPTQHTWWNKISKTAWKRYAKAPTKMKLRGQACALFALAVDMTITSQYERPDHINEEAEIPKYLKLPLGWKNFIDGWDHYTPEDDADPENRVALRQESRAYQQGWRIARAIFGPKKTTTRK